MKESDALSFFGAKEPTFYRVKMYITSVVFLCVGLHVRACFVHMCLGLGLKFNLFMEKRGRWLFAFSE